MGGHIEPRLFVSGATSSESTFATRDRGRLVLSCPSLTPSIHSRPHTSASCGIDTCCSAVLLASKLAWCSTEAMQAPHANLYLARQTVHDGSSPVSTSWPLLELRRTAQSKRSHAPPVLTQDHGGLQLPQEPLLGPKMRCTPPTLTKSWRAAHDSPSYHSCIFINTPTRPALSVVHLVTT